MPPSSAKALPIATHRVADADRGGRTQFRGHEAGGVGHPQHGDIGVGVCGNELGLTCRSAADGDRDAGCTVHHVRVGDDVAGRGVVDHSCACALTLTLEWASTGLDHRVDRHDQGLDSVEHGGDVDPCDLHRDRVRFRRRGRPAAAR